MSHSLGGLKLEADFFVCFSGQKSKNIMQKFLKKGYSHCFVIQRLGAHCLSFDPLRSHLSIDLFGTQDLPLVLETLQKHNVTIVPVFRNVLTAKQKKFIHFNLPIKNCVEFVKHVLGLHHLLILTPYQLFQFLSKKA
jgi:hypothetical protein